MLLGNKFQINNNVRENDIVASSQHLSELALPCRIACQFINTRSNG